METKILQWLQCIEEVYYDGTTFDDLSAMIVETATLIAARVDIDEDRKTFEMFAPLLWGAPARSKIDPEAIEVALSGPDGASYLESWSEMRRVLLAHRVAA